jgi:NADH-quinone oxidoreductase subunit L
MHHEQDMRKMGGLRRYMPITYATMMVGALASAGVPGFSGFFSKDAIIEAVHAIPIAWQRFRVFLRAVLRFRDRVLYLSD